MRTLEENVSKVVAARDHLSDILVSKGITADKTEKLTDLVNKVDDIPTYDLELPNTSLTGDVTVPQKYVCDGNNIESTSYMFSDCTTISSLTFPAGFGRLITDAADMFTDCPSLTTINGSLFLRVSFDLSKSTKLTHESLLNVLNSIQTVSSSQTLKLGTTNLAKLTDEEKAIATDKGWTLA